MPFKFQPLKNNDRNSWIGKITRLSLGKRACIYLLTMGALGAVAGSVDSKVTVERCLNEANCSIEELTEPGIIRIGIGACAGAIAAGIISLPAMLNEEQD